MLLMLAVALTACSKVAFDKGTADAASSGIAPESISDFSCMRYEILSADQLGDVPARDAGGTCYAVPLMARLQPNDPRVATPDEELLARNHESGPANRAPTLIDHKQISFRLLGARRLKLAGAANSEAPIQVDNFVLLGFGPSERALQPKNYHAYGTADAAVGKTGGIQMRGEWVPLSAFEGGGTATISSLDVSQTVQIGRSYQLDVREENCGAARAMSDMYLLFQ